MAGTGGDDFNAADNPFYLDCRKSQVQGPVHRGDILEHFDVGGLAATGIGQDVKLVEQFLSVGRHRDQAARFAPIRGVWSIGVFRKVKTQFIRSRLERDVIRKIPFARGTVYLRILSYRNPQVWKMDGCSPGKKVIPLPDMSQVINVLSQGRSCQNPDGTFWAAHQWDGDFSGWGNPGLQDARRVLVRDEVNGILKSPPIG